MTTLEDRTVLTGRGPAGGTTQGVLRSARAELFRMRRWPALWITVGIELFLNVLFLYAFNWVTYRSDSGGGPAENARRAGLLADMLPDAIPRVAVQGMPLFAGALVLVLGALTAGNGYGWGTVKTVTLTAHSRLASTAGTLLALAAVVVALVTVLLTTDVLLSLLVASTEGQTVVWPDASDLLRTFGGGVLITLTWTLGGVLVGTLARSPALSVGVGLVWVLALEDLLRGVASLWSPLRQVTDLLPGTAAGSLAGALGATPMSEPDGTPGVLDTLSGTLAVTSLAVYALVFVLGTGWLVRRRDVT